MRLGPANGLLATTRREAKRVYRQFLPIRTQSFLAELFWNEMGVGVIRAEENRRESFYCNRVFYCLCDTGDYFVKLSDSGQLGRYRKEQWCMEQVSALGVQTTRVESVARRANFAVMIQPWLKQESSFRNQDAADIDKIWYRVGVAARQVVSIPVQGFGESFLDEKNSWHEYLDNWSAAVLLDDTLIRTSYATDSDRSAVEDAIEEIRTWSPTPFLHHGDLRRDNLIVDRDGVVYLVDWGAAVGHIDHYSLCHAYCTCDSREFRALVKGYGLTDEEWNAIRIKMNPLITMILWWTLFWRVVGGREDDARVLRQKLTLTLSKERIH